MLPRVPSAGPLLLLATLTLAARPQEPTPVPADVGALFQALAPRPEEREACLALALARVRAGDCEDGLVWIDLARSTGGADELGARLALERARLAAWIALRDEFLAELAASGKPLALELDGKKLSSPIARAGDELVLTKGDRRIPVRTLAPEALVAQIPKERFGGPREELKIYPYCLAANPKWKRLTTTGAAAAELRRDAEEFYPRYAALAPMVERLERLARSTPPDEADGARAALAELDAALALRADPLVAARLPVLTALVEHLLELVGESLGAAELTHARVSEPAPGTFRLLYDFADEAQAGDWERDDEYLTELRGSLGPVQAEDEATRFAPGPKGFQGNGEFVWRHALEFQAPLALRYSVRWEPIAGRPGQVFAFAAGMLGDAEGRHLRVHELGFLYVDELDGPYTAVRPSGDATVQLGQTYAVELVHDGRKVAVRVDGVARAEAPAGRRSEGRVFLWGHTDLRITVGRVELEGRLAPAALAGARARWVRRGLEERGLASADR